MLGQVLSLGQHRALRPSVAEPILLALALHPNQILVTFDEGSDALGLSVAGQCTEVLVVQAQFAGPRRHLDVDPIAQVAVAHARSGSSLSVGIAARRPERRPVHLLNLAIDRVNHGLRQLDVGLNRQMQSLAVEESPEPVLAEAERFERLAAIRRGERFSQSAARREPGKKLQCIEEVALARSVRSEQDREPRKLDLHVTQRLVALDVDSLEHLSRCPAPDDGISGAVLSTMVALIIRLHFNHQELQGSRHAQPLGDLQGPSHTVTTCFPETSLELGAPRMRNLADHVRRRSACFEKIA